jgi:Flp pilus assembly protein TadG
MRTFRLASRPLSALWRHGGGCRGSQIAEFAISLPLLVLFVVGIFDFSGALTLKQKLTNAAREGARVAAADPANDLGRSSAVIPASIGDAVQVVDNYLLSEKINDCGLNLALPTQSGGLTWVATGTSCSSTLLLTINRGSSASCTASQTSGQTTTYVVNTCVTIQYPYTWRFNGVSGLFGRGFTLPGYITTTAVMFNEN